MRRKILPFIGGLTVGYIAANLYLNRKASTKALAKLHANNPLQFVHGYIYFKWPATYLRIVRKVLDNSFSVPKSIYDTCGKYLLETHHSKVIPLKEACQLVKIEQEISVTNLEQVVPFERARDIIIKNPDHIAVTDCMCRRTQENPCQPLDVCIVVGEPFASFVVEHQPDHARWISKDEAVLILEREHKRGRFHTAWFKDAAGDRFYTICNCCSCCCLGMKAFRLFDNRIMASSGFTAEVNMQACNKCSACADICAFGALRASDKVWIDSEACMGCGLCADRCKQRAITLHLNPSKPRPLIVTELL